MTEFQTLLNKGVENDVYLSQEDVKELLKRSGLWLTERTKKLLKPFKPLPLIVDGVNYVLSRNRTPIKTLPTNLSPISTHELKQFESALVRALHSELAEKDWDISLIIKNLKAIESEKKSRKYEQSELELWQA